ncbi:Negative regulator of differentiation 1 [Sphaceloma murrayae]|uniref:Negative regulator of differentiation 1 n=1 Tax=Sphaceloma murrayae TaxID=2082308 RepID=A0A2K1QMQ3_9PEZI|nr:Negative regulator of differentiation 1 [Sphaceloma murrayae]
MNTDSFGFSQAAFSNNPPSVAGYADRHPQRENMHINTRGINTSGMGDMPTPGTALDMNFTPLLPSNLLIGSPLQAHSPTGFASPQFQSFSTFLNQIPNQNQRNQHHQGMMSPQMYAQPMGHQGNSFMSGPGSPTAAYGFNQQMSANMMGGYGAPMAMAQAPMSAQSRTVYLGNIPPDTTPEEILSHVRSGQIESVRLLPDKNCAFISFLDSGSATHFHSDAILKKLSIKGQDIKIGWGKPSSVPTSVALAVQQSGASRNVYLGNLSEETTEQDLRDELTKFGPIDTVKIVREKAIGFVHFLSIGNAIKAVTQLPQEPKWQPPRRVYYGKDRCAYVSKTQQQNAAQYLGIAPGYAHVLNSVDRDLVASALAQQSVAAAAVASTAGGASNVGNRTIYLGNIHPETTIEEICNVVRGGLLHHIRYIPDKHICFVTFIDPTAAASFFALSNLQGLMIHNRRLKIGWGKHSGPLPPAISMAVAGGASRNVYVGNLDETWTEERLRQDFQEYGEIELVNTLREKSCAFVNFTNIANAIKAIEAVRGKEDYKRFKVNFGKDRCGNPPRQNMQQAQQQAQQQAMQQEASNGAQTNGFHQGNRGQGSVSPASGASGNVNPLQGPTASTVVNTGNANPLTMYLAATQQQVQQQQLAQAYDQDLSPPTFSIAPAHNSQPSQQLSAEQAFYSSGNTTRNSVGSSLDAPGPQFGHQATHSVNINGFGGPNQPAASGHRQNLSVGKSHARTVSLPVFSPPQGQNNGPQAFAGLGAGLGSIAATSTGAGPAAGNGVGSINFSGLTIEDKGLPTYLQQE